MTFPGYHPMAYTPGATPKPDPPPDVPLAQFEAARRAGATHLTADGSRAYDRRFGRVWQADGPGYISWWDTGGELMPGDAVEIP